MSHIHALNKDEITVHGSSSSRDNSQANTESSPKASKDDRVEIDTDELKDHLGLKYIVSSVEEMKALFHEVMGKRTLKASEPNTSKKARTEDASVPRAYNSSSEFDLTDIVELSTLHQGHEEPFFPLVFDNSEVCGPKISEKLAARAKEACTKKVIESKMKDLEAKYHTPENCPNLCVPKVNPELWHDLPRSSKTKDLLLQEVQRGSVKATQPILTLLEAALAALKVQEKIEPGTIVSKLADSMTFMCHASYKTSMIRRGTLKDVISSNYHSFCGQNTPLGKCLFGDELLKHIKDIAEVNKMSKKTSSSQKSSSSSGKRDKDTYNRGSTYSRATKPYLLNYRVDTALITEGKALRAPSPRAQQQSNDRSNLEPFE